MAVTNSFVHEIDISRWLPGSEMVAAQVFPVGGTGLLMIVMRTDKDEIVSTEMNIKGGYGYHVHAQLVGANGTIEMAAPTGTLSNRSGNQCFGFRPNWIPRFAQAYRDQMQAWVNAVATGTAADASTWDGFVTTAIAEQVVAAVNTGRAVEIAIPSRLTLYIEAL